MRVLLLNPPGDKLYIRSNYCSKVSKSSFVHEPVDLLVLSGIVAKYFSLNVLDCIAERLSFTAALDKIAKLNPDFIITLVGSASWSNDVRFLTELKKMHPVNIMGSGDELMEDGCKILSQYAFLDAIILDYTSSDVADYIRGQRANLNSILFKNNDNVSSANAYLNKKAEEFEIPVPRHDLFPLKKYRFPFVRSYPVASVLTDFGCPYACAFCIFGALGFKLRKIENVLEELKYLLSLGVKEVIFGDQSFAADRNRTIRLCEGVLAKGLGLSWSCYSRADLMDPGLLSLLKESGCHTIIFGVESGNDHILKRYNKGLTTQKIKDTVRLCRKAGIRTVATFIIGLPGETEADCENTIRFAKNLGCDFASFNVPVPRKMTHLRQDAKKNNWIIPEKQDMDQSGSDVLLNTPQISADRLKQLRDRAEREFYLRPSYIYKRLLSLDSLTGFFVELKEGLSLIWHIFLVRLKFPKE